MRNLTIILTILLLALPLFAGGQEEVGQLKLGIEGGHQVWMGRDRKEFPDGIFVSYLLPKFEAETGISVDLKCYQTDYSSKTMDSDLSSDYAPDVLLSYGGRVNKYSNPRFGVDLNEYLPAEFMDMFKESALKPFQYEGVQYALPISGWATCMNVNVDLVERAGMGHIIPADDDMDRSWTIEEFTELMKAVKALDDGSYGFFILAAMTGGDYWVLNMLAGFGAKYYDQGQIAIDTPEGVEALTYLKWLHDEGYVPPGAAGLSHVERGEMFQRGKIACIGGVGTGARDIPAAGFKNGLIDKPFRCVNMEYPHDPAKMSGTPVCFGPDAAMIIDNGDEARVKAAAKLLMYVAGPEVQECKQVIGYFSPLKESPDLFVDNIYMKWVESIVQKNGTWDQGIGHRYYSDVREIWLAHFQGMLTGVLTPKEGLEKFQRAANSMLGK